MEHVEYAIIGAGITGLSFADRLGKGADYAIFEASDAPGGYCKTIHQDGFTWDYSGHFFHFREPDLERELVRRMGDQRVLVVEKDSRIRYAERYVDFPFQKNIHQLPKQEFIDCLVDLHFRDDAEFESFEGMLYAKFGRSIAEKFLIPYNEKLYATSLDRLDAGAMGRFFPYADEDEIIANFRKAENQSYNATFTYPEGGAIQYVEAILSGVDAERVHLNEPVVAVDRAKKTLRTHGREVRYEKLISTAPLHRFVGLAGIDVPDEVLTYNRVEVWNLGFDRKGPPGVHWVYYPQREYAFYRVGFYDNIFGDDRMSLYVELGRGADEALPEAGPMLERILADLASAGVVDGHELVSHARLLLDPAYVHITQASETLKGSLFASLEGEGVHSIGRYGAWRYCSIEDNILEARALADRLSGAVG